MLYEFDRRPPHGYTTTVYTGDFDYILLRKAGLKSKEASLATKTIDLIVKGSRERRGDSAAHYRTRAELEAVSGEAVVQEMIDTSVIELHSKWWPALRIVRDEINPNTGNTQHAINLRIHERHPQAMYRINPSELDYLIHPEMY